LNVFTYRGNVDCFLFMFAHDEEARGVLTAIRVQNGSGASAREYVNKVLARWKRDEL
jgi:hypothetical protein